MAEEYGLVFLETSAMANINVEDAFVGLAKQVKLRVATEAKMSNLGTANNNSIKLSGVPGQSYISNCCYGGGGSSSASGNNGESKKKTGK